MSYLLDVRQLQVTYQRRMQPPISVLRHIDLKLHCGERLGVMGPSGVGKSTLAKALLGVLPRTAQQAGAVTYRGNALGAVFQEPIAALHPMLTVRRQVSEALRAKSLLRRSSLQSGVADLLQAVGLDKELAKAYPHQLSGGQRQRVMLAQAIAATPQLLIADEPTASLDSISQSALLSLLDALLQRAEMALILISHNSALLERMSCRIFDLRDGLLEPRTV